MEEPTTTQPRRGTNLFKLVEFEERYRDPEKSIPPTVRLREKLTLRTKDFYLIKYIYSLFPLANTLRNYDVREDLLNDLIAGISVGIMLIPQGMAFAALSTLPPIVGLYINFFGAVTYAVLGTGRQLSMACIAVISIMFGAVLDKYDGDIADSLYNGSAVFRSKVTTLPQESLRMGDATQITPTLLDSEFSSDPFDPITSRRMEVASGLSLLCGMVVALASFLGLSRLSYLLSDSLITGYTVGVSIVILTSQLKDLIGVAIPRHTGVGGVVRTWIELTLKIPDTNLATFLMAIICMLVTYLVKRYVNDRYKDSLRIPVPVEMLVAIAATVVTHLAKIYEDYDVRIVGEVPVGLPSPRLPDLRLSIPYIGDGFIIAIVAYVQSLALAKTFGMEHGYQVDNGQEMLASGMANVACGIFSGFMASDSVSCSALQNSIRGKTQVASLFAATVVLIAILFAGPYFYYLPWCVLAAIIVVSMKSMYLKLLNIPQTWRKSPQDCAVWVFAFVTTIVLGPDLGIFVTLLLSLTIVILHAAEEPAVATGKIRMCENSDNIELRSLNNYTAAQTLAGIVFIKIKTPLCHINSETFVNCVYTQTGIYPFKIRKEKEYSRINGYSDGDTGHQHHIVESDVARNATPTEHGQYRDPERFCTADSSNTEYANRIFSSIDCSILILDAAQVGFVDLMGIQALQYIITEMKSVGVDVYITSVPESLFPILKSTGFWTDHGDSLFVSVDAVLKYVSYLNK